MIWKQILQITFLNVPKIYFFTQLNGFMYCYVTITI